MRTTCILNLKGGVAKTTTVIHTAEILAREYHKRVLVIDADSQCNLSDFFGAKQECGTLYDALTYPDGIHAAANRQETDNPNLDILAASDRLMELDLTQLSGDKVYPGVIREMAAELAARDIYDYILIDCPPAFNAASAAALMAADDVVIPIKLDAFSLRGMANIMQQIANMRKINPRLRVAGVLPTMWYKAPQIKEAEAVLSKSGLRMFHHIRRSSKVDEMTFQQEALTCPHAGSEIDYRRFVAEYVGGAGNG